MLTGRVWVALLVAAGMLAGAGARAGDSPQWGQAGTRNQVSSEKGLPETFDPRTGKNVLWTADLGSQTWATPVVANGRVLIGTNNDRPRDPRHKGDSGVLLCLDEKSGKFLWQLVVPKENKNPFDDWPRTGIVSPPTVEGDRVYVVSNRNQVMCLDLKGMADGNDGPYKDEARHMTRTGQPLLEVTPTDADILWICDLRKETGMHSHDGAHSSILVHGKYLYVNTSNGVTDDHGPPPAPEAPSLVVIDKTTGRLVARDHEGIGPNIIHNTWSSPAVAPVDGKPRIFFVGGDAVVYGFEPLGEAPPAGQVASLKRVWRFDLDPTAPKKDVHQWQRNRREGPSHIYGMPVFHQDRLYVAGGGDLWWGKNICWVQCIDVTRPGDLPPGQTVPEMQVWSSPLEQHTMSTPAVHDGVVYAVDTAKNIHALDAATGKELWRHQAKGEIWSSPLVADGKVYVTTRKGELITFAAGRQKKVLATVALEAGSVSCPVGANGVLYVACDEKLYALRQGPEHAVAPPAAEPKSR